LLPASGPHFRLAGGIGQRQYSKISNGYNQPVPAGRRPPVGSMPCWTSMENPNRCPGRMMLPYKTCRSSKSTSTEKAIPARKIRLYTYTLCYSGVLLKDDPYPRRFTPTGMKMIAVIECYPRGPLPFSLLSNSHKPVLLPSYFINVMASS